MKTILICVQSIDGKIARGPNDPIDWTSKEDRKFFAEATKKIGVVIMGRKTHQNIGRVLPERLNIVLTSKADKQKPQEGMLEFVYKKPKDLLTELAKRGFKNVALIGGSTINSLFLKEKLIDEIWLTVEGIILGGGVSLFDDAEYSFKTNLVSSKRLGKDGILLKYKLTY